MLDAFFRILQETDHIEGRGGNADFPAEFDHVAHVLVRNDPARDLAQDDGIRRLNAEINLPQTGTLHHANQILVEIVHARLAFVSQIEPPLAYALGDAPAAFAIEGVKRIAHDHVDLLVTFAQLLHLVEHVFVRARAKVRSDSMRAVRALFGATAAGQHRKGARQAEPAAAGVAQTARPVQIPTWKGKRVEIVYLGTQHQAAWILAGSYPDRRGFRLAADHEITGVIK